MDLSRPLRPFDRFQQRHAVLGIPIAVLRKFSDDQAGGYAALIAYYAFVAIFPLLLVFTTILGFFLQDDPDAYTRVAKDTVDSAGVRRSDCELEFRGLQGAEREAFSNAMMFPDSARRVVQDSVDKASGLRNTGELSNALFNAGLLNYQFNKLDRLTMPVLVIVGGRDRAVGGPPQEVLSARLPHGKLVELPKGGHFPYLEEPERFTREVAAFIAAPSVPARR